MRRLIMSTFVILGVLGLAAGAVAAQYVTPPGEAPAVGEAEFTGQPAEVLGEEVSRDDTTTGGRVSVAGFGGSEAGVAGVAGEVAGQPETITPLPSAEERDLLSGASRTSGGRTSLLALTGAILAILLLIGGTLLGGGALLRRLRETEA